MIVNAALRLTAVTAAGALAAVSVTAIALSASRQSEGWSHTGPLVAFSARTGDRVAFPIVSGGGEVSQVIPDGRGGWFVAGSFSIIGGVHCRNLARVTASGAIDPRWCLRPDGAVDTLLRVADVLYVGGGFGHVADRARDGLAAFDVYTAAVQQWNPSTTRTSFWGLASIDRTIYVLGDFSRIQGKSRFQLAAVDYETGQLTAWNPSPDTDQHGDGVSRIAAVGHTVYATGYFSHIGGASRDGVAAVDAVAGRATSWQPGTYGGINLRDIEASGNLLYIAGMFDHVQGKPRRFLAEFDGFTGKLLPWRPLGLGICQPGGVCPRGSFSALYLEDVAVSKGSIFVVGKKTEGADPVDVPRYVGALDATTGRVRAWHSPSVNQGFVAIATDGEKVVLGGSFTAVRYQ